MSTAINPNYQIPSTPEEVVQTTLELVENNDIDGGQTLFAALREDARISKNNDKRAAFIHTLLFNDHALMVQACLSPEIIKDWLFLRPEIQESTEIRKDPANLIHCLHHCPKLMGSVLNALGAVALAFLNRFDAQQKEDAMAGQSTVAVLRYIVATLQRAPHIWKHLDWTWLGEEDSSARQKAITLGWNKGMVPEMMVIQVGSLGAFTAKSNTEGPGFIGTWSKCVRYPYSLYVLQTCYNAPKNVDANAKNTLLRTVLGQVTKDKKANPMDVALASILVAQAYTSVWSKKTRKFKKFNQEPQESPTVKAHPDVAKIPKNEFDSLLGLVDTYIALGSMADLQKLVLSGELESMQSMRTNESFELPCLVGP